MSDPVEFKWDKKLIIRDNKNGDKVLETFPEDKLERVKYANFLTKFLADQGYDKASGEKHNYVLNLNSEWGSGKTYFLRRWAEDLKEHYPVVYVDAWKQDYSDDPLMTVISSMIKQLREQAGSAEDKAVIKASRKLFGLLKAAAPSAARSLTKRYLGIDPVAIMEAEEDDDQLGNATDENGNPIDMGLAASKVVEHLISEHDAKATAIESLKMSVEQWVAAVIGKDQTGDESKRTYPAFVFIDELDRCRPSYAVEMLETIKHIFNIPGVVFVVAADTEQLQHAVKAVYGEGFDAKVYLGRFFNSRFSLKRPSLANLLEVHCRTEFLEKDHLGTIGVTIWPHCETPQETLKNIATIAESFNLSPRSTIQIAERVIATISNSTYGQKLDVLMLTVLLSIREKDETLYRCVINGKFHEVDEKGKNISFIDYLYSRYSLTDSRTNNLIIQNFNPADVAANFYVNRAQTTPNSYLEGEYKCSLEQYLETVLSNYFELTSDSYGAGLLFSSRANEDLSAQERMEKELHILTSYRHDPKKMLEVGFAWLEYSRHLMFGESKSPEFYQNLVELASALDWIDGEDEA